jgi:hypothetical protein
MRGALERSAAAAREPAAALRTAVPALAGAERSAGGHIGAVFAEVGPPPGDGGHRRVLAVPAHPGA